MCYLCFQVLRLCYEQRSISHWMMTHKLICKHKCPWSKKMTEYTSFPLHKYTQVLQMMTWQINLCILLLWHKMVDLEVFEQLKGLADAKGLITHSFLHFKLLILFIKNKCLMFAQESIYPFSMLKMLVVKYLYSKLLIQLLQRAMLLIKVLNSTFKIFQ